MRASTQAVYDQILAKLRDAEGFPLSTAELTEGVTIIEHYAPSVSPAKPLYRNSVILSEPAVNGCYVVKRPAWDHDVYPRLRQMENRGLVKRIRVPSSKRVYWQLTTVNALDLAAS